MAHQAGSAADLERLMEEYGTGLLRLCALQLGDAALAEDAAQETLLRGGVWAVTKVISKQSTGGDTALLTFGKKDVDNLQSFS